MQLRVAEQYIEQFGNLARTTNTVILPATLSDVGSMIAAATNVLRSSTPPVAGRSTGAAPARTVPVPPPPARPLPRT